MTTAAGDPESRVECVPSLAERIAALQAFADELWAGTPFDDGLADLFDDDDD